GVAMREMRAGTLRASSHRLISALGATGWVVWFKGSSAYMGVLEAYAGTYANTNNSQLYPESGGPKLKPSSVGPPQMKNQSVSSILPVMVTVAWLSPPSIGMGAASAAIMALPRMKG